MADASTAEPVKIKRRHVAAAVIGNALEFYDFTTYATFAISLGHAFFPQSLAGSEFGSLMYSLFTFGAGFALRPLGGVVLGHYADRVGRRPAMLVSFTIMALAILSLALIPSYSAIGFLAPLLAIAARLTQGFALGGEVGPTTAYLVESAPRGLRGLYASWQSASQSMASMAGGAVGFVLAQTLSDADLDAYGWRIAFLLGALTLPFGLYIRRALPESLHGAAEAGDDYDPDAPHLKGLARVAAVFARIASDHRRAILLGLFILIGGTVATYVLNYMTTFARTTLHMGAAPSFAATMVNGLVGLVASLAGGWLSDVLGRRIVMVVSRGLFFVLAYPIFLMIVDQRSTSALLFGVAVLSVLLNISSGAFYVAFTEMLPRRVRGSVFATVYAVAIAVFGGTTQLVIASLIHYTGNPMAPSWYLLIASFASLVAMVMMRETAPVRVEPPDPGFPPTA
jgi:MFS family permease